MSRNQNYTSMIASSTTSATILNQEMYCPQTTLVVIDPSVDDYQVLANGVIDGAEVFTLDAHRDGVKQITEIIENYQLSIINYLFTSSPTAHPAPSTWATANSASAPLTATQKNLSPGSPHPFSIPSPHHFFCMVVTLPLVMQVRNSSLSSTP